MDIVELRFVERLLIVIIGGVSIFLGYRLFTKLPTQQDSSGELKLPGDLGLVFSRVGPGVFFSLFGAAILVVSLMHGLNLEAASQAVVTPESAKTADNTSVRYANPAAFGDADRMSALRAAARGTIAELDGLPAMLRADLSPSLRNDVNRTIRDSKLALMAAVWAEDWGEFAVFRNWVNDGALDPSPPGIDAEAIATFRQTGS